MVCYDFPWPRVPACSANISSWLKPLCTLWIRSYSASFPTPSSETQPTASLISKQVVPYRIRGGTYCPWVPTPKTHSLADSSMTNHITWRNPTVSTIPNLGYRIQPSPPFQTLVTESNRLHHSKPCSNHSIDPHHSHLTSPRMEDQHSQY
jgi:hypothetical protein